MTQNIAGVEYQKPDAFYGDISFIETGTMKQAETKARRLSRKYGEAFAVEREVARDGIFLRDLRMAHFIDGLLEARETAE